jgi:uncharacterized protein YbaP (TraB family)
MRRLLVLLFAVAVGCGGTTTPPATTSQGSAPPPVATIDAAPAEPEPEPELPDLMATKELADKACPKVVAPYFYRVEKDGKVGHLLGTRHMSIALDKMPAVVKQELAKAKLLVFETPPGESGASIPMPGDPLSKQLGPELWGKYQAIVGEATARAVDEAGPAAAMVMMMLLYEYKFALLDVEIEQFATSNNIKTGGLESSAFQEKLLAELLDVRMLRTSIKHGSRAELRKESVRDITEYCAGTATDPGMDERTRKQMRDGGYTDAEIDTLDRKLLDDRNDAWMPQLAELFGKNSVFVVVGADHLIGKRGVAAMLGARGFKVTRVIKP